MRLLLLAVVLYASIPTSAFAEMPGYFRKADAQSCGETYAERLTDFRDGMDAVQVYRREYNRVMPWFREHCRFLEDYEIAIRRIDTAEAIVCDTKKGRPKGLTAEFALAHQFEASPLRYVQHLVANDFCAPFDHVAGVPVLSFDWDAPDHVRSRYLLAIKCWQVKGADCDRGRAALAEVDASDPLPAPKPLDFSRSSSTGPLRPAPWEAPQQN